LSYNVAHPVYGLERSTYLSSVYAYASLSRSKYSTPTFRPSMFELFVLTSSRVPLPESEEKCTPAETPIHQFRRIYFDG